MIPDVYEIFELEFHHILDVYDSVQEAVNKLKNRNMLKWFLNPAKAQPKEAAPKPMSIPHQPRKPPTPRFENRERQLRQLGICACCPICLNSAVAASPDEPRKRSMMDTATLPVEEK